MIKSKSFQKNMFFSVGTVFVLFALCFSIYQYRREKEYKIDILHARLQMYNYEMMHSLRREGLLNRKTFMAYIAKHNYEGMRLYIVATVLPSNVCRPPRMPLTSIRPPTSAVWSSVRQYPIL